MIVRIRHSCEDFDSYRAARVKSLFNCEDGYKFELDAHLPIEERPWSIGVVVGPSGSGKTSIGRRLAESLGACAFYEPGASGWPKELPIIEAIAPDAADGFNAATSALTAVGLGSVPAWLRPYHVLSNGERFRADLARIICARPRAVVIDEFSSVVDRQIARVGAAAFARAWRRADGQCVLLSCHRDILPWVSPCWVYDTAGGGAGEFRWGWRSQRPAIEVEIRRTDWSWWNRFEPHHYLKLPRMIASKCYVAFVRGEPVAHLAVGTKNFSAAGGVVGVEARACRLVVMPEWQGIGLGMRFLNEVCRLYREGRGHLPGRPMTTLFHTSHPGLCAALRRDRRWVQISASLFGANKRKSAASIARSMKLARAAGYGGHFRAVQGFRYYGEPEAAGAGA